MGGNLVKRDRINLFLFLIEKSLDRNGAVLPYTKPTKRIQVLLLTKQKYVSKFMDR